MPLPPYTFRFKDARTAFFWLGWLVGWLVGWLAGWLAELRRSMMPFIIWTAPSAPPDSNEVLRDLLHITDLQESSSNRDLNCLAAVRFWDILPGII